MTIMLSMVTYNRRDILKRTLAAIEQSCTDDDYRLLVTDNASSDGTGEMLREMETAGKLKCWCLKENMGTAAGRNAHWAECIGHDSVRIDDKVLPLLPGWLTSLSVLAHSTHTVVAVPYDPTVLHLWQMAPLVSFVGWPNDQGEGGPLIYIPGEVTEKLGGVDELAPDIKYGWDDCLYIERAKLIDWGFGFSLRSRVEYLASANPARRNSAEVYSGIFHEVLDEYRQGMRDVFIPIEQTVGYKLGQEARE